MCFYSNVPAARPPPPPPPAPAAAAAPQGPGLMGQMMATAGGVAIGSTVGHVVGHALTGGGSAAVAEQPAAPQYAAPQYAPPQSSASESSGVCAFEVKQFLQCAQDQHDLTLCDGFNEALRQCKAANGQFVCDNFN